jgi:hypothetical protein|tara:strand:- start:187 stop:447 length:261 start_codon:yes stop_codon:yes gene_type:complete
MGLTLSVVFMTTVLFVVVVGLYKLISRLAKWGIMTNKALLLLSENREIENLPSKTERFKKLVEWKQKRDSLLDSAESLEREFSEAD